MVQAMAKVIRDSTFIGEGGIAVVQRILMEMRLAWPRRFGDKVDRRKHQMAGDSRDVRECSGRGLGLSGADSRRQRGR